jgi:molybdopterin converting factor subunit 1
MKILFFAQSREAAGCSDYEMSIAKPLTQSELWRQLSETFPGLVPQRKVSRLARNGTYVQEGELLNPEDEVAVIPPVSGG